MNYLEIDQALISITRQTCDECRERLNTVPKENITERKALQLEYGMYTFCGNCGFLFNTTGNRGIIQTRRRFLEKQLSKYPTINSCYSLLDEEEKMRLMAALQAELYLRDQWLDEQLAELSAAEASGDTNKTFEFKIKISAVNRMFEIWEAWRKENNVYPNMFEEIA